MSKKRNSVDEVEAPLEDLPPDDLDAESDLFGEALKASEQLAPPTPSAPPKTVVTAAIFARVSGIKAHQLAGFLAFATRTQMRPRPVEEWREALERYQHEPI